MTEGLARQGYTRTHRFLLLPSPHKPRWLLPLGNALWTSKGFQIYTPYTPMARMLKSLLLKVIHVGWIGRARRSVEISSRQPLPIEVLVAEVTGECDPVFALALGTPGRFRKLTVQVMRRDGEILGYIKLPLIEAATARVRRETAVLERLWNFPPIRSHIPKVLYAGEWGDGYILFQSPGPSRSGAMEFGRLHEEFLQALWGVQRLERPGHVLVEEVAAHWQKADPLLNAEWRGLGERVLKQASRKLGGVMIPCGIAHGDFAPWNTRVENGRLFLFDWESAAWEAPNLWDYFHFHVQVGLLKNKSGRTLSLGQAPSDKASFLLYMLSSACQWLEEVPNGHAKIEGLKRILHELL